MQFLNCHKSRPVGLKWRSSSWLVTSVVALGVAVDLLVYSIIIPVMPFHLEHLGYSKVSAMTGWLLFAYSGGLVLSTIPIALLSERYAARQLPLIFGLLILLGSQVMLMEATNFLVMCVARVLQGIGSSMVWVVGLALLCDSSPPSTVGLQLGVAMTGLSVGVAIGPPVGGLLYNRFGYRAPFIFGMGATAMDLIGRLLVVERKHALKWGIDPRKEPSATPGNHTESQDPSETNPQLPPFTVAIEEMDTVKPPSLLRVIRLLGKSRRATCALFITLAYGIVYSSQEPSIPLHLQDVWQLSSGAVGLVFLAAVIPTFISSPLSGYLADKQGTHWVTVLSLLFALPWWGIIVIQKSLALFIASFAIETFFTSGVISPVTAELAAVSRQIPAVGYGHVYGAFNLAYGIGTTVGPVIGGQLYDNLNHGWMVLCLLAIGILAVCCVLAALFIGEIPLRVRFYSMLKDSNILRRRGED